MSKKKIFNDPVYGFITIYDELIFDIIEHPYFQRLRRIKQLGLTDFVYPGALHTRFHHALGAMHLMHVALQNLRSKGHEITDEEYQGALIAILLHDIGHGPFSHALEWSILNGVSHETLSLHIMQALNEEMDNKLTLAIDIFQGKYQKKFLSELVSSQLDIDRLDYLQRDCYFTGVSEGTIGANRIIKMLDVYDNQLVVEEKGIYSVENFLNARRLMYWQVYLHKTSISAEQILILIFQRAKELKRQQTTLYATPALEIFLSKNISEADFSANDTILNGFLSLDDYDIWGAIKMWQHHDDKILKVLSRRFLNRQLYKVVLANEPFEEELLQQKSEEIMTQWNIEEKDLKYYLLNGTLTNAAYISKDKSINILTKKGTILDVAEASDLPNITAISQIVRKYYICFPKK